MTTHYWFPLPQSKASSEKYTKLRKLGEVFLLYRKGFVFSSDCDVPISFDTATKTLTVLLRGENKNEKHADTNDKKSNLYISTDCRELERLKQLEAQDGKKRSLRDYMSALKPILLDRLNKRGLSYRELLAVNTDRVLPVFRQVFELSIERVIDKYFIQPE